MGTVKAKKLDPKLLTSEHVQAYASEIAECLEGWSYRAPRGDKNSNTAEIVHTASGAAVNVYLDAYRGQLEIAPSTWVWDPALKEHVKPAHGFERIKITVSLGRPAASVARDMDRRGVLANALAANASMHAERAAQQTESDAQSAAIATLNASGLLSRPVHVNGKIAYLHTEHVSGSIGSGRVRLDALTVSPEKALQILRILAE